MKLTKHIGISEVVGIITCFMTLILATLDEYDWIYQLSAIAVLLVFLGVIIWIAERTSRVDGIEKELCKVKDEIKTLKQEFKLNGILHEHDKGIAILNQKIDDIIRTNGKVFKSKKLK